jgi:hypothetical protein
MPPFALFMFFMKRAVLLQTGTTVAATDSKPFRGKQEPL